MEAYADSVSHPRRKRAYRSVEERRRIVEETLVHGVSVATVARAHGINANQVFGWRKLYRSGLLKPKDVSSSEALRLLPVTVAAEVEQVPRGSATKTDVGISREGAIELTVANARVRITGQVDAAALRIILESLRG